ncbi:MAG: Glu/Leu/Phe/Val dehydrogenase dimerization domain-containing protein, partial [Bacteroidota bacterium]
MTGNALDPMLVAHYRDRPTGAEAWLVVDTFLHGVAGGGIRMAPDVTETLMKHLAATMSVKLGILQPPCGGAKCGIRYDPKAPDSKEVLGRVVRAFAPFLQTCWVTGSDLGTDWHDVVTACREQAGIPHPQFALMKAYGGQRSNAVEEGILRLTQGTSFLIDELTGLRMSDAVTGWTVCAATEEALTIAGESLAGKRIALQGFGAVGGSAAKFLAERGAVVASVSDEAGAIVAQSGQGLDVQELLKLRVPPGRKVVDRARLTASPNRYELAGRDDLLYLPVDVLIPAAGSYIPVDISRVQARWIVEAANDPFTVEEEESLHRRGITVVPDAIANSGSAGLYGLLVAGQLPITDSELFKFLSTQVRTMTRTVLAKPSVAPRTVLEEVARAQIHAHIKAGHAYVPNELGEKDLKKMNSDNLSVRYRATNPYADLQVSGVS